MGVVAQGVGLLEWVTDPAMRSLITPAAAAGVAVVLLCSALSPIVVLKRFAFVGQGVSHSAFGGIGVAAVLGLLGAAGFYSLLEFSVILLFCVVSAVGMAVFSDRRTVHADTAIGIFLVASMALGAVLLSMRFRAGGVGAGAAGWEGILFGQILLVSRADTVLTWVVASAIGSVLFVARRPVLFWAFDETAAAAYGVSTWRVRVGMMVVLAFAVVTAMKVVGVVLATALLVLPGATALRLSDRLAPVMLLSLGASLVGLFGGMVISLGADLPMGACIVLVLTGVFVAAWFVGAAGALLRSHGVRGGASGG